MRITQEDENIELTITIEADNSAVLPEYEWLEEPYDQVVHATIPLASEQDIKIKLAFSGNVRQFHSDICVDGVIRNFIQGTTTKDTLRKTGEVTTGYTTHSADSVNNQLGRLYVADLESKPAPKLQFANGGLLGTIEVFTFIQCNSDEGSISPKHRESWVRDHKQVFQYHGIRPKHVIQQRRPSEPPNRAIANKAMKKVLGNRPPHLWAHAKFFYRDQGQFSHPRRAIHELTSKDQIDLAGLKLLDGEAMLVPEPHSEREDYDVLDDNDDTLSRTASIPENHDTNNKLSNDLERESVTYLERGSQTSHAPAVIVPTLSELTKLTRPKSRSECHVKQEVRSSTDILIVPDSESEGDKDERVSHGIHRDSPLFLGDIKEFDTFANDFELEPLARRSPSRSLGGSPRPNTNSTVTNTAEDIEGLPESSRMNIFSKSVAPTTILLNARQEQCSRRRNSVDVPLSPRKLRPRVRPRSNAVNHTELSTITSYEQNGSHTYTERESFSGQQATTASPKVKQEHSDDSRHLTVDLSNSAEAVSSFKHPETSDDGRFFDDSKLAGKDSSADERAAASSTLQKTFEEIELLGGFDYQARYHSQNKYCEPDFDKGVPQSIGRGEHLTSQITEERPSELNSTERSIVVPLPRSPISSQGDICTPQNMKVRSELIAFKSQTSSTSFSSAFGSNNNPMGNFLSKGAFTTQPFNEELSPVTTSSSLQSRASASSPLSPASDIKEHLTSARTKYDQPSLSSILPDNKKLINMVGKPKSKRKACSPPSSTSGDSSDSNKRIKLAVKEFTERLEAKRAERKVVEDEAFKLMNTRRQMMEALQDKLDQEDELKARAEERVREYNEDMEVIREHLKAADAAEYGELESDAETV